jgi:hypothetical protein
MSSDNLARSQAGSPVAKIYKSATSRLAEPFPADTEDVFVTLEALASPGQAQIGGHPSSDNIEWAKNVLLHVLPRAFLRGAEIVPFETEVHVTWEKGDKKVVVFLPKPQQLKIYSEQRENGVVKQHKLVPTTNPAHLRPVLEWLFR